MNANTVWLHADLLNKGSTMKEIYAKSFEQFSRMFSEIATAFDEDLWIKVGHNKTVPQKLAFHILQSTKFYMNDKTSFADFEGRPGFPHDQKTEGSFMISQSEIIENIGRQEKGIRLWLEDMEFSEKNELFPWTGPDRASVVLFVVRHSNFHLGELNCLHNESLQGNGDDFFAKNIW